jgi:hypothetical protein
LKLVLDWQVSAFFGWGVYGLNLALELSRDLAIEARQSRPIDPRRIGVDALRISREPPAFRISARNT